jgi:citrate synthase
MSLLKDKFGAMVPGLREDIKALVTKFADVKISEVTVGQAYGGMRGVKGMVCDTSVVEPDKGLIIRGIPVLELTDRLPEEIFWLLLTGDLPTKAESENLRTSLLNIARSAYVWDVLSAMPPTATR